MPNQNRSPDQLDLQVTLEPQVRVVQMARLVLGVKWAPLAHRARRVRLDRKGRWASVGHLDRRVPPAQLAHKAPLARRDQLERLVHKVFLVAPSRGTSGRSTTQPLRRATESILQR